MLLSKHLDLQLDLCDAKDIVLNLLLCWNCLKLLIKSLEIKTFLQKYYVKVAESIVLVKRG